MNDIIKNIEIQQRMRFEKRKNNLYDLLDKPTKKQISKMAKTIRFMFKNDDYGSLSAELLIYKTVSQSALTLNILESQILKHGVDFANKGSSIEQFLTSIKDSYSELMDKKESHLSPEKQTEFDNDTIKQITKLSVN